MNFRSRVFLLLIAVAPVACRMTADDQLPATADGAATFVDQANEELLDLSHQAGQAEWVQANFITEDTESIAARADEALITREVALAKASARWDDIEVDPSIRRQMDIMKKAITMPAPADPALTKELTEVASRMQSAYGKATYCPSGKSGDECLDVGEITQIMATSRDPRQLTDAWVGWRTTSRASRADYQRFVELSNQGARELGYADTGAMWRSNYDMAPEDFADETDRLWGQVKPLYTALHCYVRKKLSEKYGTDVVPLDKPIPAQLLGNIWAQQWNNIYDIVAPKNADPGYDLTKLLKRNRFDAIKMVQSGEGFFTSLGFDPLPATFWTRSLFTKPRDRDVVCHASAWDVDNDNDLRIKMCIAVNAEDFRTVHHELGHNFYQRAYNQQPYLFRNGANDGFHEAIGDAIALSVTPAYLKKIGLLKTEPPASKDIGLLLNKALEKVAFLPFGLLVDRWRWGVFSGDIPSDGYNAAWWDLREKYQGVRAPVARSEDDFDPGAKYHVPANTPYSRYFLAHILQFQFHRSMCGLAGNQGPLNRCTIFGSKEAGSKLDDLLSMGMSRPWPDALETLTDQRDMDATAIIDYFAPLKTWLDAQNEGLTCGW